MSDDEEWHYIQVSKLGRAWVGWGQAKNQASAQQATAADNIR